MLCVCLLVKFKGKPDAGNPLVRFDEGEGDPSLLYLLGGITIFIPCDCTLAMN
jgi:hypothetical protein